ncbi:MAG TPA: hypothetical protein VHX52_09505 [Steroidobacteraceae bacterium]|jgi:hypothetical protein|nr:hypothetical protein [Steroidobacteraceae bacterium]
MILEAASLQIRPGQSQGFRQSPQYQQWRALLHHFYDPFPTVLHYRQAAADAGEC